MEKHDHMIKLNSFNAVAEKLNLSTERRPANGRSKHVPLAGNPGTGEDKLFELPVKGMLCNTP